ncbi:type II secretion system protein GspG [Alicyclobacillus macrosporangiidus]|uniref:General secretion pathway protein G n=1 Tax=Alicyclobacillus macrosporangiidus TaxID=392015 RepID=A0A1I7JWY8_9BACL|nr:prepilin-type N-terminal cleavage/methylation domain-containing protein [Alicyclobacillus macrosporangiidus]SFU89595.1 general secretion pathway protein G [Alicyclobacillus macrosporangiidus]
MRKCTTGLRGRPRDRRTENGAGGEAGFTLLEMVVAVLVLAVMMSVVAPHVLGVGQRAESVACEQNQRNIRAALDEYQLMYHKYPAGNSDEQLQALVDAQLLDSVPRDPGGGHYILNTTGNEVVVTCDVHGELGNS